MFLLCSEYLKNRFGRSTQNSDNQYFVRTVNMAPKQRFARKLSIKYSNQSVREKY